MDRERAKELAPIIAAYGEGKEIQVENIHSDYCDIDQPYFESDLARFRIKPTPKLRPMTRGEVLYMVTTTPGMVMRVNENCPKMYAATELSTWDNPQNAEWGIIDERGEVVDGWHKFETRSRI